MTIRRLILSFVVAGLLAVVGAAPAAADPVFVKEMPAAACDNPGTHDAHQSSWEAGPPARPAPDGAADDLHDDARS